MEIALSAVLLTAFISGSAAIIRAISKNMSATRDNTAALTTLTDTVSKIRREVDDMRIKTAIMEDRMRRRWKFLSELGSC